jgi:zinc transport system ATP-binding protein
VSSGRLAQRRPFLPASRADRAAVEHAIELVGLTERADDGIHTLSGGQQQRALIARAAAGNPDILVLDEPNAGVDRRSQDAFARSLRTFVASGRTVLLVLHEMGPLAPLVNRGVVLDGGRIVHDGPIPETAAVAHGHAGAGTQAPTGPVLAAGQPHDHPHGGDEEAGPFGWNS